MSARIHQAQLVTRRTLAFETVEFVFGLVPRPGPGPGQSDGDLRFRPGQFISVEVGRDAQQNPILRSYSIASPPERRGELALVLKMVETGVGSRYFDQLRPGETLRFTGPMDFFVNELEHPGDAIYVATGTGIAPILPMLAETLARPEPGRVQLFWGLRSECDVFWQDEIAALQARHARFTPQVYLSQPQGFARLRGRVTGPVLETLPGLRAPTFYLCGNGKMIEELKAALVARGVNRKRQIRTEAFFD